MFKRIWRPRDEQEAVEAEAVLLEWLGAVRGVDLPDPAALRAWARRDRAAFRAAFAEFMGMPAGDAARLDAVAGWLLGAGLRPDDWVLWTGDPADPALAGLAPTGARLADGPAGARRFDRAPAWPPSAWPSEEAVRPPA